MRALSAPPAGAASDTPPQNHFNTNIEGKKEKLNRKKRSQHMVTPRLKIISTRRKLFSNIEEKKERNQITKREISAYDEKGRINLANLSSDMI